jgi:hypothetical protein
MLKAQDGANHTARSVAHMVGPLLALVASHVDFFFSSSFVFQKNDVAKCLGPFDVEKVSETQKHLKTRKFASLGLFRKPPENNGKQVQVLMKLSNN